jgi:hypothetical protein
MCFHCFLSTSNLGSSHPALPNHGLCRLAGQLLAISLEKRRNVNRNAVQGAK